MDSYVVKRRTAVRVSQLGGENLDGLFCLALESPELHRPETILDLLNSSRRMVPFVRMGDRRISLLSRLNIPWVLATSEVARELIYPPHYVVAYEELVQVHFNDGGVIEGNLQVELTGERVRASDFLNSPGEFFPMLTRMGTLLANKSGVRETVLVNSRASAERTETTPTADPHGRAA